MSIKNKGFFGQFGGQFVPETLFPALEELEDAFLTAKKDKRFNAKFQKLLATYVGRPTPLYFAENLSQILGRRIYIKREDLNHTGAHKINNTLGQVLLAKKMKKKRVIAETGAGQHGVATATAAALMGLDCTIYMGEKDTKRQALNVYRMTLLGAKVVPVTSGSKTLKDAATEALRDWLESVETTHFVLGSVVGPHPYPTIVKHFQSVIGKEAKRQIKTLEQHLPDAVIACVGGGSNAMGIFSHFIKDKAVQLIAVEGAGKGLGTQDTAASLSAGTPGILQGSLSYLLQDKNGQVQEAHSISAGLDYPGVGPELSALKDSGRLTVGAVTDDQAVHACKWLAQEEGIIPALESAHAIAYLKSHAKSFKKNAVIIVNLSGRGDKDMDTLMDYEQH